MLYALRKFSVIYLFALATTVIIANFWIFARFTVDDAFITWRYGKNLVENGLWTYNPWTFDLTQAYTNPIYAFVSIIPSAANIDTVFFFKILSLCLLAGFTVIYLRLISRNAITLIILTVFLTAPKTVIHVFSGLETFLYITLTCFLFIALDKRSFRVASALVCILVLTRPEAWLLAIMVPVFAFLVADGNSFRLAFKTAAPIALVLIVYFSSHLLHFGELLPNTFYAKSYSEFSTANAIKISLALFPMLVLVFLPSRSTLIFIAIYSIALAAKYMTSTLAMNYADRFVFHVFGPVFLYAVYKFDRHFHENPNENSEKPYVGSLLRKKGVLAIFLCTFGSFVGYQQATFRYVLLANYAPRLHSVHSELGHILRQLSQNDEIESYAMGDAGATAYHSGIPALDFLGLGSRAVTRTGITTELVHDYEPDVIVFYANIEGMLERPTWHDVLLEYSQNEGFKGSCLLIWDNYERLEVHSRRLHPEIESLCAETETTNDVLPSVYLRRHILQPPWTFWHD